MTEFVTLSDRLTHALKELNVSMAELARRIGVKHQAVRYLCCSKANQSRFTYQIADALGLNPKWLATGIGNMFSKAKEAEQLELISVPVMSAEQLRYFATGVIKLKTFEASDTVCTHHAKADQSVAYYLQDQAMYPRFEMGSLLILATKQKPKEGQFMLCLIDQTQDLLFRQLVSIQGKLHLVPFNTTAYCAVPFKKADKIVGVMTEARWIDR